MASDTTRKEAMSDTTYSVGDRVLAFYGFDQIGTKEWRQGTVLEVRTTHRFVWDEQGDVMDSIPDFKYRIEFNDGRKRTLDSGWVDSIPTI